MNKNIIILSENPNPPQDAVAHWRDPFENILHGLGYDASQPPMAEFLRRYHRLPGKWLIVSPVYFHTTHNDSVIAQCGSSLNIDDNTGRHYFTKVQQFLAEDGINFYYHSPTIWLAQLDTYVPINSYSPAYLHNKSLMPYLEKLSADLSWQKRLTECQMLLETMSASNSEVNGLWFWGQGHLTQNHSMIASDDIKMASLIDVWPNLNCQQSMNKKDWQSAEQIILSQNTEQNIKLIETICQSSSGTWYWNNITYKQAAKHWWQLLWRKLR